jgi:hypothetical protein
VHEVVIDGTRYAPVTGENGRPPVIGVAITTRNRRDVLDRSRKEHLKYLPPGAKLVIVDDASTELVPGADYRFEQNAGIARAKNKCLELLAAAGCEHLFLFDDDAYPIADGWWQPYVDSPEPHLMAIYDRLQGKPVDVEALYRDEQHVAYHATRGYMLYVERRVLDVVGGMDPRFGKWGWEHVSWSDRIHAAGLTTWRYADVAGSGELIHAMDQHGEVDTVVAEKERQFSTGPGLELRMRVRDTPEYVEYRQLDDVVLTTLLTSRKDPQRGRAMKADAELLGELHDSLRHTGRFVVLHTGLEDPAGRLPRADLEKVPQGINPYFERWIAVYRWLRAHPEVGRVWCVDGTDVQMLRDPFKEMEPELLYTGYEPTTLRNKWMLDHHPDKTLQEFMRGNPNLPLLNAGILGGSRDDVMGFAHAVTKMWFDDHIDNIMGWEKGRVSDASSGDMAVFNYVARTMYGDRLSTGPHVCTVFKAEEKNNTTAFWKHK